jgi:outer membrane protein
MTGPSQEHLMPESRRETPPFLRLASLACALLALAPAAKAQSLKELYEAARGYDATYLSAKALHDSARHRVDQSEALLKPSASLTASATTAQIDLPIPRNSTGSNNTLAGTLSGRYPLVNRSSEATIAQARKSLEVSQADLDTAEQDLIVRVSQAYFDVLASRDALATTQAGKAAITEQLASAKRNFEVGTATITDAREAQAAFDRASAAEIAAENDLRTKQVALDQLVGRRGVSPSQLRVPVALPPVAPADAEAWVGAAEQQHPTIRRARVGLDVARLETAKARAAEKYTLDAVGAVGATHATGHFASTPGTSKTASIGLQFSMPLYTAGATQSRIQETLVLEEKARQDHEAARRGVTQGTRVAFLGLQSLHAQVKALEAAEASSKLALEATQLGYKVGVRVNLDVLNAQSQLFQTQRDLAKARYDVIVTGLRLRQAAGQLAAGDIDAVSRLLAP